MFINKPSFFRYYFIFGANLIKMNFKYLFSGVAIASYLITGCAPANEPQKEQENVKQSEMKQSDEFVWQTEQFADVRIIRYQVPSWEKLNLNQKILVYCLAEASLAGRDIIWDQNYKHNIAIRKALEGIIQNYSGDKSTEEWMQFITYAKRVFFSNGIHHHYGMGKFIPQFTKEYFNSLLKASNTNLNNNALEAMFNPEIDAKRVNLDPNKDLIAASANNFYEDGITEAEVDAYYKKVIDKQVKTPISYGLNSTMIKKDGQLMEDVWKADGRYGGAIKRIIYWLNEAKKYAESEDMRKGFELLIKYYQTGDLKVWDEYNIQWVKTTNDVIDYINGFIEVYGDAKGFRGTYESIIQITDFDASERMKVVADHAQYFEDNSTILPQHKKENVTGVSYKVVNVAIESGDASPSTPIGVNLPNANWIRANHGSKSVSLGNIVDAYDASSGASYLEEFAYTTDEVERGKKHGKLAGKLHTALHEVIGHASGKLEDGIGTPKETLKNYASTLEEARADLVALYYILDPKLIEMGLMETLDVGKAEYDGYIRNGLMVQLRRIEPGQNIEESHMRNRQLVAKWAFEKGAKDNVIERITKDGKTYFVVNDYDKLRVLFGELLKEIQRIKSQGDYQAGRDLVENYGVIVDADIHQEVLKRSESLNIAPYGGFINPQYTAVFNEYGEYADIEISYPTDFVDQMLFYGNNYSNLP